LIIGSDEGLGRDVVPPSVRLLGENKPNSQQGRDQAAREEAAAKVESSAAALLDERVSNAKSESAAKEAEARAAKKVEEASASPLVKKVLPPGYFAQVAAPKKLAEAEGVAKRLKRSGFPVVIESTSVAGQSFYRVLVGPEDNRVQADRLVSQLKSESYVAGDPFIRKVK
jgi:cell division septation protein DedD